MAAPVGTSTAGNPGTSNTTTCPVTLPNNLAAGDLLIVAVVKDGTSAQSWPTDPAWTTLVDQGSGAHYMSIRYRVITGAEGWGGSGNSITVNNSTAETEQWAWATYHVAAGQWEPSTPPEAAGTFTTNTPPDPPPLNPSTWDVEDTRWVVMYSWDNGMRAHEAYPSGFVDDQAVSISSGANGVGIAVASLASAVASVDPGTATLSRKNDPWGAATIAIRPAPSGVPITVSAPTTGATMSAHAPTVVTVRQVTASPPVASCTAQTHPPTVTTGFGYTTTALPAAATATGHPPTVEIISGTTVTAPAAAATTTAPAPEVGTSRAATVGALTASTTVHVLSPTVAVVSSVGVNVAAASATIGAHPPTHAPTHAPQAGDATVAAPTGTATATIHTPTVHIFQYAGDRILLISGPARTVTITMVGPKTATAVAGPDVARYASAPARNTAPTITAPKRATTTTVAGPANSRTTSEPRTSRTTSEPGR